ncbi:4Fe-4S binding protein [Desulfopila aestuarii]|uniref:Ferredoxin-type protein NapH n=1 Tax=Desulfopila aestuarii DSM 18488 TaxID=1121416 RepID=A0A1M7XVE6_9BACT|nr:4Fe-4S binding protein [Desulfopila aestuarii]SHO42528.1 ferredoxin-type protein NapH [Desulfopila aestuarii DSM 18488]
MSVAKSSKTPALQVIRWSHRRLIVLTGAFMLIAINPFLNYFLQIDFVQGWYQSLGIGSLWFVSPLEGLESLLITKSVYMPALVGMLIPVILAFLLGRVFCSWLCPVSFLLELLDRLRRAITRRRHLHNKLVVAKRLLWFTLIAEFLLSMILGAPLFVFLSPPGLVGREIMMAVFFHKLALEGVVLLVVIVLEFVTRRMFCRTFCPLGGLLALIGSHRRLVVQLDREACTHCGLCNRSCPMGLQPEENEAKTAYCWNCGECLESCQDNVLAFTWRKNGSG